MSRWSSICTYEALSCCHERFVLIFFFYVNYLVKGGRTLNFTFVLVKSFYLGKEFNRNWLP